MNEDKIRPALKTIPKDGYGMFVTTIFQLVAIIAGAIVAKTYVHGANIFSNSVSTGDFIIVLVLWSIIPFAVALITHLRFEKGTMYSLVLFLVSYVTLVVYTYGFTPNGGESPIIFGIIFVPFLLIGAVLASLVLRYLINKFGTVGTVVYCLLLFVTSLFLSI